MLTWAWASVCLEKEALLVKDVELAAAIFEAVTSEWEAEACDTICEVEADKADAWVASIFAALLLPVNASKLALRPLASTISLDWLEAAAANFEDDLASEDIDVNLEAAWVLEAAMASVVLEAIIELFDSLLEAIMELLASVMEAMASDAVEANIALLESLLEANIEVLASDMLAIWELEVAVMELLASKCEEEAISDLAVASMEAATAAVGAVLGLCLHLCRL